MKKLMVVAVALVLAASAMAQILPVAQTADPTEVGKISATVGLNKYMGDFDPMAIGARCSYGVIENLLIIGDVGMVDIPHGDSEVGIGIAAQYSLAMLDLPVELAVRLGLGVMSVSDFSETAGINAMALVSYKIEQVDGLAVYGGVGFEYLLDDDWADSFSVLVDVGAKYALPVLDKKLSVFAEMGFASGNDLGASIAGGAVYAF